MRFLETARKIRKAPFHLIVQILAERIWKKLLNLVVTLRAFKGPIYISDAALKKSTINRGGLNQWFDNIPKNFFIGPTEKNRVVELINAHFPNNIGKTLVKADKTCRHIFNLLGSGDTFVGETINWHKDFKSGHVWQAEFYKRIPEINLEDESDIKVPWDLSRFHHAVTLGKAFWYTGDEKYEKEFFSQFEDWYDKNPPLYGVNWSSTMDVAIRAVNLIWGIQFFRHSKNMTETFKNKFLKSMLLHGRYIISNLEYDKRLINDQYLPVNGNHYLSNLVGLIYLGIMFPFFRESKRWLNKGMSELFRELDLQVYDDGVSHELSISYHRLIVEMSISALMLLQKAGLEIPQSAMKKLERMIEFVLSYTKPDGECPVIKDADDGRLHILDDSANINDHRYLLCMGALLFNNAQFKAASGKCWEEVIWLFGADSLEKYNLIQVENPHLETKSFHDSGYYVLRKNNYYMFVTCTDIGMRGFGGHSHNDCLSFELYAGDKAFVIDPGSYVYSASPKWRNMFRSTAFHNTARIDEEEINRIRGERLFYLQNDAVPQLNAWNCSSEFDYLDIQHSGYNRLQDPVTHRRQIVFDKALNFWVVTDMFYGDGGHKVEIFYHFNPRVKLSRSGDYFLSENEGFNIALMVLNGPDVSWEWREGWVSKSYGMKEKGQVLVFCRPGPIREHFSIIIYPFSTKDWIQNFQEHVLPKGRFYISPEFR